MSSAGPEGQLVAKIITRQRRELLVIPSRTGREPNYNELRLTMLGEGFVLEDPYYIIRKRPAFTHLVYVVSRLGESAAPPGLVHLREHMLERPPEAIASRIERSGGVFDAETFFDYTSVSARLIGPSRRDSFGYFEPLLELPSMRTDEELERERDAVLIEEARRSLSEPSGYVSTMLFKRMYGDCPLGRTYEDVERSLGSATLEDVARLHEEALKSSFLMLVGAASEIPEPIAIPSGKNPPERRYSETGRRGTEILEGSHEGVSYVSMAADVKPISDFDSAVAALIERYLAAHTDAVLYSRLRVEEGIVYDIYAQMYVMRGLNVFLVEFESKPENAEKAVEEVLEELEALANGEVDEEVLEYSRNHLLGSLYRAYEDLASAGTSIIRNEIVRRNPFRELRRGPGILEKISAEDVVRFADEFLRPDRFYVEILMPKTRRTFFTSSGISCR